MQKWEYFMFGVTLAEMKEDKKGKYLDRYGNSPRDFSFIWENPLQDETAFQYLTKMGEQGWELVGVTPHSQYTNSLLFTLKRPKQD